MRAVELEKSRPGTVRLCDVLDGLGASGGEHVGEVELAGDLRRVEFAKLCGQSNT
jgi:hypothetical protein